MNHPVTAGPINTTEPKPRSRVFCLFTIYEQLHKDCSRSIGSTRKPSTGIGPQDVLSCDMAYYVSISGLPSFLPSLYLYVCGDGGAASGFGDSPAPPTSKSSVGA
ncbi:hypothetical protein INR49_028739 [Caranx melampygus]|nr:hypothetical protein INR49_028739 [Caranx melampygus]